MSDTWLYLRSEPGLWTVGYYRPDGRWEPESDHGSPEEAAQRVHRLNGGCDASCSHNAAIADELVRLAKEIDAASDRAETFGRYDVKLRMLDRAVELRGER